MATTTVSIRTDVELKKQAEKMLADMGLNMSTAMNIYLHQIVRQGKIPFEISTDIPNDITVNAMNEYYEMQRHPEKYKRYSSFKDAMNEVLNDA